MPIFIYRGWFRSTVFLYLKLNREVELMKTRALLKVYKGSEKEEVFIVELQKWKGNIA
jgi:hypothetical protein